MRNENFKKIEFYRKELEKLIYNRVEGFNCVLTTDELREKMFSFLKPEYKSKNDLDVTNINWTTGVYDKESGIFLTLIYYVSDGIARCGVHYHSYIAITDTGSIFKVIDNDEFEKGTRDFRIPEQYKSLSDKIKEGIEFYGNCYEYSRNLSEDIGKKLKAVDDIMDDRCHRNYVVNSERDARKLFELVNFNEYTLLNTYNKKTISDFNKYATEDKIMLWRGDKYLQLLKKVLSPFNNNDERCRNFSLACHYFMCGVNDTYDEQFLKAVKYMYKEHIMEWHCEDRLEEYINQYVEKYPNKLKNIAELIECVKANANNRFMKARIENVERLLNKR